MKTYDTLYDTLAAIWHIPRAQAKARAYRVAFGLATNSNHPDADAALLDWLLKPGAAMPETARVAAPGTNQQQIAKAATFHQRYGVTTYGAQTGRITGKQAAFVITDDYPTP